MTQADLWEGFETGRGPFFKLLRFVLIGFGILALIFFGSLSLSWPQQAVLGLLILLLCIWLSRASDSYLITLTLMMMSMFATFRYAWWRIATVAAFFRDPGTKWGPVDAFFILLLLGAEAYAFSILYLGFLQTVWPLRRAPVALPDEPEEWPEVDLLIPTYNEPLNVVRYTALASLNIDWPADKLHVYILDDGNREEFRQFAVEAGIGYMTRGDNVQAKAGNINHALRNLHSPFVAVFDSDHVPTRSFLQMTMGWFQKDPKLGMLQTPHHFYSPDPFERNLGQFRVIPNEGELFYGIVQDGNDFWNAAFFCGSCAVLRRSALDEIGGIASETVTEDAHTSLRMQVRQWNSAYINIPQAAGLATERLSAHVKQRIRWARGMVQILRLENPLFAPNLSLPQRLCYFNAMTHFLYALPRLIFLTAPLIYLIFGFVNVPGYWIAILAYALPHLTLSSVTNSRIQGYHRHSFWNEIYETVLSPYILLPTLSALINPKSGKFNVTSKGGLVTRTFFDARIAQPFIVLLAFNVLGLLMVIPRFLHVPGLGWLWDGTHPGTIITNALWTSFNIVILSVCIAVAREARQTRQHVRINFAAPVRVLMPDGRMVPGQTIDVSSGGLAMELLEGVAPRDGDALKVIFPLRTGDAELPARVVDLQNGVLRLQFDPLTVAEEEMLTMVLFSRADSWLGWGESREVDQPLRSLGRIVRIAFRGLGMAIGSMMPRRNGKHKGAALSTETLTVLLLALGLAGWSASARAQGTAAPGSGSGAQTATAGGFHAEETLVDLGAPGPINLKGEDAYDTIYFATPQNEVVRQATMRLFYHFSPSLIPALSHLKVMLNGTVFATVPVPQNPGPNAMQEADLVIPAELLVRNNQLTFEFIGHYAQSCEDPTSSVLWAHVDPYTRISFSGDKLALADDLKLLPLPFFDSQLATAPVIPISFGSTPSLKGLEAAGVLSSWFGALADYRAVRFPISVGTLPTGNAVLIAETPSALPPGISLPGVVGPTVAVRVNPVDPYGKVLIITGTSADQTLEAAQAVAMGWPGLQGATAAVTNLQLPTRSKADDAPRWQLDGNRVALWNYNTAASLQSDGNSPMVAYFRVPPDLFYGDRSNLLLHLDYRYNSIPIGPISSMQVELNDAYLGSMPLTPGHTATRDSSVNMGIPVVNLRPFSNSMNFQLTFQLQRSGGCHDTFPGNMMGAILRSSYIDLRGLPHWATMPNLELFSNAGFPFTRFADLSQTDVVMAEQPTAQEIETYVTLMGHFGAETGFPALRVTVSGPDALQSGADTDFLVIETGQENGAIGRLAAAMPVTVGENSLRVQDTRGFFATFHNAWWKIPSNSELESGELDTTGVPDALIEEVESPFESGRTVVLVDMRNAQNFDPMMTSLLETAQSSAVSGTVALLSGTKFESYRIGNNVYHVGILPWWTALSLWFMQVPWMVDLVVLAISFIFAIWIRGWLRAKARRRLQLMEH
ncbi:MAG TPA: UDP-forming cellulose synthase catalytic subunit [Acidobacteriaceae bacterium]|jgi:cellulose synthase (UDP-forming)|nr:UDP-forming cellulose synthase catalytic subunit [Acidobacteriaceae bacterium]